MTVLDGMVAGAAGTWALNVVSYADVATRARPQSGTPQESVRRLADRAHINLGPEDRAANRRSGLGALLGYATGLATGAAFGALAGRRRIPLPVAALALGTAAMVGSDGPLTALKVTDPRTWSGKDWVSDIVPHLAYGVVAATVWRRLTDATHRR